jgi:hypothetical protein
MKKLLLTIFAALALAGCGEQLVDFPLDFATPPDYATDDGPSDGGNPDGGG